MQEHNLGLVAALIGMNLDVEELKELKEYLSSLNQEDLKSFVLKNINDFDLQRFKKKVDKHIFKQSQIKNISFMHGNINDDFEKTYVLETDDILNSDIKILNSIKDQLAYDEMLLDKMIDKVDNDYLNEHENLNIPKADTKVKITDEVIKEVFDEIDLEDKNLEKMMTEYLDGIQKELSKASVRYNESTIDKISKVYTHLSREFIIEYFDLKQSLALEYKINSEVILLHRSQFKDLTNLQEFVNIVSSNNYHVNVDENKLIVDSIISFRVSDGKILSEIFEIADITAAQDGYYEGYLVEKQ